MWLLSVIVFDFNDFELDVILKFLFHFLNNDNFDLRLKFI